MEEFDLKALASCEESDGDRAYRKVLRMASVREISSAKVRDRLARDGFNEEAIAFAIDKAVTYRIVCDDRYADALIRSRLSSGKGLTPALREIEELGIDPLSLDSYCDHLNLGEEADVERALDLLSRKPPRGKNVRDGAYRRLMQAGFSSSVASRCAREWAGRQGSSSYDCYGE